MTPQARYRERMRAQGRCPYCGKSAEPGFVQCSDHRRANRAKAAQYSAKQLAAGRCPTDGNETSPGRRLCDACLAVQAHRERRRARALKRQRRCYRCGQQANGYAACQACRDKDAARQRARRAA